MLEELLCMGYGIYRQDVIFKTIHTDIRIYCVVLTWAGTAQSMPDNQILVPA